MKALELQRYDTMRRRQLIMKKRAEQAWHDKHCPNCAEERIRQGLAHMMQRAMEEADRQIQEAEGVITELQPSTKH